jgi:hypothetical protein
MDLARAAHREALNDIHPPRPERRPSPFLGMPDLPPVYVSRDATYGQLFAQLSRCVRQAILLEARLAAGAYDHPDPAPHRAPTETQPQASQPTPARRPEDRPRLRPEQLEDDLAHDAARPIPEILAGICAELGAAVQTGLSADQPAAQDRRGVPTWPHRPPPLSQAERAAQLARQCGIPPPTPQR